MAKELTTIELKVIDRVMSGQTKTQAMREEGYSFNTYDRDISRWWQRPKIATEMQRRRKKLADKSEVDSGWLVDRLKAIVELDISRLVDMEGNVLPMHNLPPALRQALTVEIVDGKVKKITQSDRLKAMDQLARLGGLYEDKIKIEGEIELKDRLLAGRKRAHIRNSDES